MRAGRRGRRLVVDVGVELDVTESGLRSLQRRFGKIGTGCLGEGVGVNAGDLLGEPEVLGQRDVAGHFARRSNSSRSRSSSRLARLVKSSSPRTRWISALSASTMSALTLVPLTRATASASSARSSGSRTVVCLVIEPWYRDIVLPQPVLRWEPSWEPFSADCCGRPGRRRTRDPVVAQGAADCGGRLWTDVWRPTDQKVGGSSPSGRAAEALVAQGLQLDGIPRTF